MGSSGSKQKENRRNEVEIDGSTLHSIDSDLLEVCPKICKILHSNKNGSGFFIRLYLEDNETLFALMTNEHIITGKMIEDKEEVEVFYNNQKKRIKIILDKDKRFIKSFKEMKIDCTVVQILPEDNINEDYFLVPNLDYNEENYKSLIDNMIYIVQFPKGNFSHSKGKITDIIGYELNHKACTDYGSSGSPIFLIQSTQVIGIHKAGSEERKENYGDVIFPIINELKKIKIKKKNKKKINKDKKINKVKIMIKPYYEENSLFGKDFINLNNDKLELIVNGKNSLDLKKFNQDTRNFLKPRENNEIILKERKTVRDMSNMFRPCYWEIFSIDFRNWDTSNVTSMKKMFYQCNDIKGIYYWNTSKVRDMSYMFMQCKNIPDISYWDTSNVNDMSYMFNECNNIPDISNWNTSNVKDMSYMFSQCENISDISNWDTSNVKLMTGLFFNSIYLSSLPDLSKWNTSNVKDFSKMFDECKSLRSLPDISKWNTSSVQDMSYMFHNCWSLTTFPDISNWNIFDVQNMSHMFHNCWSVSSFQQLNWNVSNVKDMSFMFHNFPLQPFAFNLNFFPYQIVDHMFTNFYSYHNDNTIINCFFSTNSGSKIVVVPAYKDMLIGDVIDLFLKKSNILNYNGSYLYNGQQLGENTNLTIGEIEGWSYQMNILLAE